MCIRDRTLLSVTVPLKPIFTSFFTLFWIDSLESAFVVMWSAWIAKLPFAAATSLPEITTFFPVKETSPPFNVEAVCVVAWLFWLLLYACKPTWNLPSAFTASGFLSILISASESTLGLPLLLSIFKFAVKCPCWNVVFKLSNPPKRLKPASFEDFSIWLVAPLISIPLFAAISNKPADWTFEPIIPVSYTHLTLPTILLV